MKKSILALAPVAGPARVYAYATHHNHRYAGVTGKLFGAC
nr:hypothetical protein pPsy0462b_00011 [Pseudomonas syringae]